MDPIQLVIIGVIVLISILFFMRPKPQPLLVLPEGPLKGEKTFIPFTLVKKVEISHDTKLYEFGLEPEQTLGLPVGQHIYLRAKIPTEEFPEGEDIKRKYTPVSGPYDKGSFTLLIKIYHKNVHPKYPEGGKMSQYVDSLQIGDSIDVSGPRGLMTYQGNGLVHVKKEDKVVAHRYKNFGFVCGGTGLAPCIQVIKFILQEGIQAKISLIFANKSEEDILMYDELKQLPIDTYFTLDNPPKGWEQGSGFVTADMLTKYLPAPGPDTLVCTCGPVMMNRMLRKQLAEVGHLAENVFKF